MKPYNSMYKKDGEVKEAAEVKEPEVKVEPIKKVTTEPVKKVEEPKTTEKKHAKVVNCAQLNVRKQSNIQAPVIEILESGSKVETYGTENAFTKVHTQRGMNGFCMTDYLEEVK